MVRQSMDLQFEIHFRARHTHPQCRTPSDSGEDISFDLCHGNAAHGVRCTDRAALDGPQVPGDHDALPGVGHRCSRRVGPGDYSVRREGRPGAAKVCRRRNPFSGVRDQKRGRSIQKSGRSIRSADAKRSGFGREAEQQVSVESAFDVLDTLHTIAPQHAAGNSAICGGCIDLAPPPRVRSSCPPPPLAGPPCTTPRCAILGVS